MSIPDIISEQIASGRLLQFVPTSFFEEQPVRGVFMTPELYAEINNDIGEDDHDRRLAFIRGSLAHFVMGGIVDNEIFMKCLRRKPEDIWEFRVATLPPVRIFGMFAMPDTFICSHIAFRGVLGGFQSEKWKNNKNKAAELWDELFPGLPRFKAERFESYVTINGEHHD